MESNNIEPQQNGDAVMEVPEIDGGDLLVELLDATLAAEDGGAGGQHQLGFAAGDVDGDCWIDDDSQELIHAHVGCEDCGLDGVLDDFEEYGGSPRPRSPAAAPYAAVFGDEDTLELEWVEAGDAGMGGPFAGGCMGDWYMDGFVMAMEWEEEEDGGGGEGNAFSFEPVYGGEAGAEQVYGSPLWE
ncbi:unnamed protein product [Urochloa decumbens]|uniref:Uncharacterized protein n=1 Tax=Urochloa decumbens TaxID=240449 RepID=A0ABC8YSA9_9POAL